MGPNPGDWLLGTFRDRGSLHSDLWWGKRRRCASTVCLDRGHSRAGVEGRYLHAGGGSDSGRERGRGLKGFAGAPSHVRGLAGRSPLQKKPYGGERYGALGSIASDPRTANFHNAARADWRPACGPVMGVARPMRDGSQSTHRRRTGRSRRRRNAEGEAAEPSTEGPRQLRSIDFRDERRLVEASAAALRPNSPRRHERGKEAMPAPPYAL
jgi:hypothetical protein